jgi:Fe-S cluster biosynthesis and repair protein YggX
MDFQPWPGETGERVLAEICQNCWQEWMGVQTKIINEYRLNVLDPEHAGALRKQMAVFFGFEAPPEQEG